MSRTFKDSRGLRFARIEKERIATPYKRDRKMKNTLREGVKKWRVS